MSQELTVVISGSTGKQGGAVARGLLERGHKVRAVTRDTSSSQAKSLASAGATLVAASLEDPAALTQALEGATSLFAMTTPSGGTDAETRQGVAAADAAKAAGVHLVFTSVGSANRRTGIPHFDSKYAVEKHIAKVGVRATILALVAFMENLYFIKSSSLKGFTRPHSRRPEPSRRLLSQTSARLPFASSRTPVASPASASTSQATSSRGMTRWPFSRASPATLFRTTRSHSMSSASVWARMPSRCTNGSTTSVLRWIAPRFAVNFPTSPSMTSSLGRRRRIGMRFLHETACGAH
jgi:hypothetical protein